MDQSDELIPNTDFLMDRIKKSKDRIANPTVIKTDEEIKVVKKITDKRTSELLNKYTVLDTTEKKEIITNSYDENQKIALISLTLFKFLVSNNVNYENMQPLHDSMMTIIQKDNLTLDMVVSKFD